jgi:hypothetical protein
MSTNLVIVCGDKICFSDFFKKQNGLLNRISLINFCDIGKARFVIPLTLNSGICFPGTKIDPTHGDSLVEAGPLNLVIHNDCASETYMLDKKVNTTNLSRFGDSFYCRSNNYNAETAAVAASFIYTNSYPQFIFHTVFKALGENCPPILVGSIRTISEKIEHFNSLESLLIEADKFGSKKTKKYKEIVKQYDQLFTNPEEMLGLKRIKFSELLKDTL